MTSKTWVESAAGSLYDVDNLPYGVFSREGAQPRVGVRIGDSVLDAAAVATAQRPDLTPVLDSASLNALMAAGAGTWSTVRQWLQELLTDPRQRAAVEPHLHPLGTVELHLPVQVGDYVDFYASIHHASNVGKLFRPDAEPLLPNWRHLPVGYHGRAGSVVVTGTDIRRPWGQRKPKGASVPSFGPSQRLDIEAELGFVVGTPSELGRPVPVEEFAQRVFGVVGVNDWSARDIQAWEYVPLGPFLGKSFATSIAAWVTPLAALEAARVELPGQDPEPLEYLRVGELPGYDIDFEVVLNGEVVARPPYRSMYWSPAQMLAHMTINGASVRTGDLFASGTISGPARDERGSFLELSWGGAEPFTVDGTERSFLQDGDEVVLRLTAPGPNGRLGLGEVSGRIVPSE